MDLDLPAVVADDPLDDHQPEPGTFGLRRVMRLENLAELLGRDARPGVLEGDGDEAIRAGHGDFQQAAVGHRLDRVPDDIEERLLDLVRVELDSGQILGTFHLDEHVAVLDLVLEEGERLAEYGGDGAGREAGLRGPDRAQELGDDLVQPRHLVLRHVHQLLQGIPPLRRQGVHFALKQLEVDVQRIERIADFVGHAGGEQGQRVEPLGLDRLRLVLSVARDVAKDDHGAALAGRFGRERNDIEIQEPVLGVGDLDFAAHEPRPLLLVQLQHAIPLDLAQMPLDRIARDRVGREPQQFARRAVRVRDPAVVIEYDQPFAHRVENRLEQSLLVREMQEMRLQTARVNAIQPFNELVQKGRFH